MNVDLWESLNMHKHNNNSVTKEQHSNKTKDEDLLKILNINETENNFDIKSYQYNRECE